MLDFLWFLLIGLAAGWIAAKIMHGRTFGVWRNMLLGVTGALLGGLLFRLLNLQAQGSVGRLVMSTAGAVVLLFVVNWWKKWRSTKTPKPPAA